MQKALHDEKPPIKARASANSAQYSVGSLVYTRFGLISLFGWLLWGDFIYNLMESLVPLLMPVLLKDHGASNRETVIIVSTLGMVANAVLCPIISFKSDRYRSKYGRRRPFILFTTPFVVLFLSLIPFSPDIAQSMSGTMVANFITRISGLTLVIIIFGIFAIGFHIANMFISSVYSYLIPDVVPPELMGRFLGLFRVFGSFGAMAFHYFVFGWAEHYMREIFVGCAIIYGVVITLMCLRVKEGAYRDLITTQGLSWWSGIWTYARECFGKQYFWWAFLTYSIFSWTLTANTFSTFFYRDELGFSLDAIGKMTTVTLVILIITAYPFGMIVDRYGPQRVLIVGFALSSLFSIMLFIFGRDKGSAEFWTIARSVPWSLTGLAALKWPIEIYPRERFGQFCSAGALFCALGGMVLGPLCGMLIDFVGSYRYFLIWSIIFPLVGVVSGSVVYRQWRRTPLPSSSIL